VSARSTEGRIYKMVSDGPDHAAMTGVEYDASSMIELPVP
jgi:hypothetical protein